MLGKISATFSIKFPTYFFPHIFFLFLPSDFSFFPPQHSHIAPLIFAAVFSLFPSKLSHSLPFMFPSIFSPMFLTVFCSCFLEFSHRIFCLFPLSPSSPIFTHFFSPFSPQFSHPLSLRFPTLFFPHASLLFSLPFLTLISSCFLPFPPTFLNPLLPVRNCSSSVLDRLLLFFSCNPLLQRMGARAVLQEAPAHAPAEQNGCAQLEESHEEQPKLPWTSCCTYALFFTSPESS